MKRHELNKYSHDELMKLLSIVPDNILRDPIKKSPKDFMNMTKGFRVSSIPMEKIHSRYVELILEENSLVTGWADLALKVFFDDYFGDLVDLVEKKRPYAILRMIDIMLSNQVLWSIDVKSLLDYYGILEVFSENELVAAEGIRKNVLERYQGLKDNLTTEMITPLQRRLETETKNLIKRTGEVKELKLKLEASKNEIARLNKELNKTYKERENAIQKHELIKAQLSQGETSEGEKQRIINEKIDEIYRLRQEISDSEDAFSQLEKENIYYRSNSIVADSSVALCRQALELLRTEKLSKNWIISFADEEIEEDDTLMEAWDKLSQLEKKRMVKTISAMDINNISDAEIGYVEAIEGDLEIMKLLVKNLKVILMKYMEQS